MTDSDSDLQDRLLQSVCIKGGRPHSPIVHGSDGHEFPHNPWSEHCVKTIKPGEPTCPDARCMTCDGAA